MSRMAPQDHPASGGRPDPHGRLLAALLRMAGEGAWIEKAKSRPWASATFQGSRHVVEIGFAGDAAHAAAVAMAEIAPRSEFGISGHIVADVSIDGQSLKRDGEGRPIALLRLSALVIEDW